MKTLHVLVKEYLEYRAGMDQSRGHVIEVFSANIYRFTRWLEAQAAITRPDQVTAPILLAWLQSVSSRRNMYTGLPLKPRAIDAEISQVRVFCARLVELGHLPRQIPEVLQVRKKGRLLPMHTPDHKTVRKYLRSLPDKTPRDYMFRVIAELLYSTGMRPCEALAMSTGDIDFENGLVKVLGKRWKPRMLPMGRTASRMLESYLSAVRPLLLRDPEERAVWLNPLGCRLSYQALIRGLHHKPGTADSDRFTCYSFRRACATELIRGGVSLWMVKEMLGHEHIDTVEHYVNLTIMDLQKTHARCHPRDAMGIS